MYRSAFRTAILSLLFVVLALLAAGCGEAPATTAPAATAAATTPAPVMATAVEPTAITREEPATAQPVEGAGHIGVVARRQVRQQPVADAIAQNAGILV